MSVCVCVFVCWYMYVSVVFGAGNGKGWMEQDGWNGDEETAAKSESPNTSQPKVYRLELESSRPR
jgi:hypothetical protein